MGNYLVNKNKDEHEYHEVHLDTCKHLPYSWNQEPLGSFPGCFTAIIEAERRFPYWKIDGCRHCSEICHNY